MSSLKCHSLFVLILLLTIGSSFADAEEQRDNKIGERVIVKTNSRQSVATEIESLVTDRQDRIQNITQQHSSVAESNAKSGTTKLSYRLNKMSGISSTGSYNLFDGTDYSITDLGIRYLVFVR